MGGLRDRKIDIRIIAATNQQLEERVQQSVFRDDLYYRLKVIQLTTPPLRDRGSDIVLLAKQFIAQHCRHYGKAPMHLSDSAQDVLMQHHWPGNVRELRNLLEQVVLLNPQDVITPDQLPLIAGASAYTHKPVNGSGHVMLPAEGLVMEHVERGLVQQALERTHGNATQAAKLLGMSRDMMRYRIEKYQL